ncbi:MAG: NAD(P)-dependent oxidoreductase [Bryobacteraceae bacterium]|jgi:dTDP-glucose 4,6-dehydratase
MENRLSQDLDHILDHTEGIWAEMRGERIFVTGGTGFVGSWLLESLLWANRRMNLGIRCSVLTRNPAAFVARLPHLACDEAVTLCAGDAATFEFPDGSFPLVVHAATERYGAPDAERPASVFPRDIAATERVLQLARRRGTRRLLFTSSGAVYGKQPAGMTHIPEDYPGAPLTSDIDSAYGQSKRASEFLCAAYAGVYGFDAAIARLFAFVGPYLPLDANYAVGNFLRDVLEDRPVKIAGDGTPYRSYLYAADLAIWLWTMLTRAPSGTPFNVGSSHEVTIAELARRVVQATMPGTEIRVGRKPLPGAAAQRYVPATGRAERELGLRAWISLEEGVRRTFQWHAHSRPMEAVRG